MEQFNLDTWLQDKSRKVVTRRGNSVRIICTDANEETPIAVLVTVNDMGQDKLATALYTKDGRYGSGNSPYDLFFADEEELTEFEKELIEFRNKTPLISVHYYEKEGKELIHNYAQKLLDLARKEIEKENPYNEKQKQEWSEEDSKRLARIHQFIWANRKGDTDEIYQQEQDADWLMSLIPQQNQYDKGYEDGYSAAKYNQWKPTDKQMEDFRMLLDYNIGVFDYAKFMSADSLYEDLKKNLID